MELHHTYTESSMKTTMPLLIVALFATSFSLATAVTSIGETEKSLVEQLQTYPLFAERLEWSGSREPSPAESTDLLRAAKEFKPSDDGSLRRFIAKHPHSAWTPAIRLGLADYYAEQGRYSLAVADYEAAWNTTKRCDDASGQRIAGHSVALLTTLLAKSGQMDRLDNLLKEVELAAVPLGTYGNLVSAAKSQLRMMQQRPGDAFKCGLSALSSLASSLNLETPLRRYLLHTASPSGGFTLAQLLSLARTNGLAVEAVRRPPGAELISPCIVHWKYNHYAVITPAEPGLYQITDSTSERSVLMTAEAIAAEGSGVFLLPRDKVPAGWLKLTAAECAEIRGGCYGPPPNDADDDDPDCDGGDEGSCSDPCDPPSANDGASGDGDDGCASDDEAGMPRWRVSEPYINLWLHDTPLRYRLSSGRWMPLKISYKQRSGAEGWNSRIPGFGPNWSCNWIGFVNNGVGMTRNHMAGGGVRNFRLNTPDYKTARSYISSLGLTGSLAPSADPFVPAAPYYPVIESPTGSRNLYTSAYVSQHRINYFLTQRADRYGRKVLYNYTSSADGVRLTTVQDVDGRIIQLGYNDARESHKNLITSVTDPYNRTCYFFYDADCRLTNVVDTIGFGTTFDYGQNNLITNMHTVYGDTHFKSFEGSGRARSDGGFSENRALLITEPNGSHQLYAFCGQGPWDYCGGDGEGEYRNSYHWNRAQYAKIPAGDLINPLNLPDADYYVASIKHWLHADATMGAVCDTVSSSAGPVDPSLPGYQQRSGIRSFWYQGQSEANYPGTLKRVTKIWDGSWQIRLDIRRNAKGRPSVISYYNSDGTSASYTNHYDGTGIYLQKQYGPHGELVRGYGYTNSAHKNLLTSVTNALGEVTRYTHDPVTLHVTSVAFASGLVRTNLYFSNGPNLGFLQMQADIGFRTNYFSYTNGNVSVQTNELGLVTANTWDLLNRLVETVYPDTTTISNCYDKLDVAGVKDRLNQWTHYVYNDVRQLRYITNANQQLTMIDYCGCGSPASINHWAGSRWISTSFSYDTGGRLTNTIYADQYQVDRTYDENDLLQTISDSGGRKVALDYAFHGLRTGVAHGYMISADSGPKLLLSQDFDDYGRVTNSVDRNGVITGLAYDVLDRVRFRVNYGYSRQLVVGSELFIYGPRGLTNYLDPSGQLTTSVRDASGRELFVTNANHEVLRFTYDPADNLLSLTDGKNQTTSWHYDTYGQVTNKVDANGAQMFRYEYDPNGRLTNRWQAGDVVTAYRYDPLGNLTNIDYPATHDVSLLYDPLNRLTHMVDVIGATTFMWTDGNQLAKELGPWISDTLSNSYDHRLRSGLNLQQSGASDWAERFRYDEFGRLTNVTSAAGSFGYEYERRSSESGETASSLVKKLSYPTGGFDTRGYDDVGRLLSSTLVGPLGDVPDLHGYSYNSASQCWRHRFQYGGRVEYAYDNIGQLQSAKGYGPGLVARPHEKFGYGYDAAGNLNWRTNNNLVLNFRVNNLNELTNVSRPANSLLTVAGAVSRAATNVTVNSSPATIYGDDTFALEDVSLTDGANTFTAQGIAANGDQGSTTLSVNLPSAAIYSYDERGNLLSDGLRTFAYDDENQLTSVTVSNVWRSEFEYDGLSRRRIRRDRTWSGTWSTTNEVHYIYDGRVVIQERNANNVSQVTYTRGNDLSGTFEGAGGIGGLLARTDNSQLAAGNPFAHAFYYSDGNGNITCMIAPDGGVVGRYSYDPFGNILAMSGTLAKANLYRFSTKEYHPNSGLLYYLYRYHDSNLQRWLNRDPIGEWDASNLYAFVSNDPVNLRDDLGLQSVGACVRFGMEFGIKTAVEVGARPPPVPPVSRGGPGLSFPRNGPFPPEGLTESPHRIGKWGRPDPTTGRWEEVWRFDKADSTASPKTWRGTDHLHHWGNKDHLPLNTPFKWFTVPPPTAPNVTTPQPATGRNAPPNVPLYLPPGTTIPPDLLPPPPASKPFFYPVPGNKDC